MDHVKKLPGGIDKKMNNCMEYNETGAITSIHGMAETKDNIMKPCTKQSNTIFAYVNGMQVRAMEEIATRGIGKIEAL